MIAQSRRNTGVSHIGVLWFPIGGPSHTSSGWLSDGLCSISTVRQFSASKMKARRTVAVAPSCQLKVALLLYSESDEAR